MPSVEATVELRNYSETTFPTDTDEDDDSGRDHDAVELAERDQREVTLERQLTSAEDAVWAIEAKEHTVVWDLWEHVDSEGFEDWSFCSPYPPADVTVDLDYEVSIHEVVWHIAARDEVEPAAVYLDLMHNPRLFGHSDSDVLTHRVRPLAEYLTACGFDLSDWPHGRESLSSRKERQFPDEMLWHAEVNAT